jgi:CRP-like cAMP-binding protein
MPIQPPVRPIDELHLLATLFKPYAKEHKLKAKVKIKLNPEAPFEERRAFILSNGEAALYRNSSNLLISHVFPGAIFGLGEMFAPYAANYLRAETDCTLHTITVPEVMTVLNENNAWPTLTTVMSYYLQYLTFRDLNMVGNTTYRLIRNCIYEYHGLPPEIQNNQALSNFIQNKTALSRSLIMKILLSLKTGGYIEIKKGRLVHMNKLPLEY